MNKFSIAQNFHESIGKISVLHHSNRHFSWSVLPFLTAGVLFWFLGCSSEEHISTQFLEYRLDADGTSRIYKAGDDEPIGKWKYARVSENHPNGNKRFEIGFVDGLKHGAFYFWQSNGLRKLVGSFDKGNREGTFSSFGRAGELLYEKNYFENELEGNFSIYYPMSNAEVFRYFEKTRKEGLNLGDIPVKNNIRLEATFSKGIPVGPYRTYFHPRGQNHLTKEELLEEEGRFDENGQLMGNQVCYYPRTEGLVVYVLENESSENIHPASPIGLAEAIDECYQAIQAIPAYRNPKGFPALVYCVDRRSNRITPVWSSDIHELAIRNFDGNILNERYQPSFESYQKEALVKAKELSLSKEISLSSKPLPTKNSGAVEIIALNKNGEIHDILWSEMTGTGVINLEDRISSKRKRIHRSWQSGKALSSEWSISNGLNLIIQNQKGENELNPPSLFLPNSSQ